MNQKLSAPARLTIIAALLATAPAWAQTAPTAPAPTEEIVVTGTLIRGIAPTGTNVVGVTDEDIVATGKASSVDLLNTIPQLGAFNTIQAGGAGQGTLTVRPALRGLTSAGNNPTLIMLNGHRMVGVGILGTSPDPSVIPPGVIDHVDVVPDGGSSIYGSDAVGGVINFVAKKRFEGVAISGHYGKVSGYRTYDFNLTAGKDWGSGSAYASFAHAEHDNILGSQRDFVTRDNRANGGSSFLSTTACVPGKATVAGVVYNLSTLLPDTNLVAPNGCDPSDTLDYYPKEKRDTVYGHLYQEINNTARLEIDGYASKRKATVNATRLAISGTITPTNPYYKQIAGTAVGASQAVAFGLDGAYGASQPSFNSVTAYGLTGTLTWDLNANWQVRSTLNLGKSNSETRDFSQRSGANDAAAFAGTTTATAINPYNPSASNSAVLASIQQWDQFASAEQKMSELRVLADGEVGRTAGGSIRVAVGAEYHHDNYVPISSAIGVPGAETQFTTSGTRSVASVFGEVFIPLVGSANAMSGVRAFDISLSVRNDKYSGTIGGTTNPKIGFNYKPVDDLTIRGNYGESFNAPNLGDTTSVDYRIQPFPNVVPVAPGVPNTTGGISYLFAGGNPNLKPETAKTTSYGADWKVSFVPGLKASVTWWNIDYKNQVGLAPFTNATGTLFTNPAYASFFILQPTQAQFLAFAQGARLDGFTLAGAYSSPNTTPYIFIDARRNNLSQVKINGIDFNFDYRTQTSFGSIYASIGGTNRLKNETIAAAGAVPIDNLANGTRKLAYVGTLGGQAGAWDARLTLNVLGGYPVAPITSNTSTAIQTRVDAFKTTNLFVSFDLEKAKLLSGASVTLNIDNISNKTPPYFNNSAANGTTNGSTVGRLVTVGFDKKF